MIRIQQSASAGHRVTRRGNQRGMTLMELLLAVLLASFVMVAVVRFVEVSLGLWAGAENSRKMEGRVAVLLDRMARDLETVHPGQLGDMVVEWVPFDLGDDAAAERILPRARWVRRPSGVDWQRMVLQTLPPLERTQLNEEGFGIGSPAGEDSTSPWNQTRHRAPGLVEVLWALVPSDRRSLESGGTLYRAEQMLPDPGQRTLMRGDMGAAGAYLDDEELEPMANGVLWFGIELAGVGAQMKNGTGEGPGQVRLAWDGLGKDRPDRDAAQPNTTAVDRPTKLGTPVLPKQVRITLELESPDDVERRPRLAEPVDREVNRLLLTRADRLPKGEDVHLRIGGEWMLLTGVDGDAITVVRGQRGTLPSLHKADAIVHFGHRGQRMVVLPTTRFDPAAGEVWQ